MAMLDELHDPLPASKFDRNIYTLGSIGKCNVVITCPSMGTAAPDINVMTIMFYKIKFNLLVGVGSGIPPDIRLGDVVVGTFEGLRLSEMTLNSGDAEAKISVHAETWATAPPYLLLLALKKIKTEYWLSGSKIPEYLETLKRDSPGLASRYLKSDSLEDLLFDADYGHVTPDFASLGLIPSEENDCRFCDKTMTLKRHPREMRVHYGLIASANQEIKSALLRDGLSREFGGKLLCIEMETAKMNSLSLSRFPCLVIRGICDYADSHKNKEWRDHAAIMAAAYAKDLLQYVFTEDADREQNEKDVAGQTIDHHAPPPQQPVAPAAPPKADEYLLQNPRSAPPPPGPGSVTTSMPYIPMSGSSSEYPPSSWPRPQQASPPTPPLRPRGPPPPPTPQHYAPNFPPWMPFSYNANPEGK